MTTTTSVTVAKRWTPAELRRLPAHEREVVLQAAAELAEPEYRTNPELTAFEALGKDDLHGDTPLPRPVPHVDLPEPFRGGR